MSDKDRPPNPFGRGDRTIIRPNPGGRLPSPPPPPAAGRNRTHPATDLGAPLSRARRRSGTHRRCPVRPFRIPRRGHPAQRRHRCLRPGRLSGAGAGTAAAAVPAGASSIRAAALDAVARRMDFNSSTGRRRRRPAGPQMPTLRVDDLVAPNANPIMRAAGPLLLLLGRLRVALLRASFASLMEQVADAIKFFEKDIRSAGIPEQQANSAKYILCATADDIVQHIPTEDRHVWTQYSMLSRFFGERIGGVRFFEDLDHAKLDPLINYPLLELQHACLALGFQGMYRATRPGIADAAADPARSLRDAAPGAPEGDARSVAALAGSGACHATPVALPGAGLGGRVGRRRAAARRCS